MRRLPLVVRPQRVIKLCKPRLQGRLVVIRLSFAHRQAPLRSSTGSATPGGRIENAGDRGRWVAKMRGNRQQRPQSSGRGPIQAARNILLRHGEVKEPAARITRLKNKGVDASGRAAAAFFGAARIVCRRGASPFTENQPLFTMLGARAPLDGRRSLS